MEKFYVELETTRIMELVIDQSAILEEVGLQEVVPQQPPQPPCRSSARTAEISVIP
ncbi:hypothetical protein HYC85_018159 [Camellia sinensis]|uniref:Uncharacterized protein n=1 Tax=Camellia sinensis TaxID=4442 RepID=A0A7J7GTI4_CAMSI|nr:hypothetical protein HYC85_018159 [Camellia sinensis]